MALFSFLLLLLLLLLPFHLLGAKANPSCRSISCGNLSLEFPFTRTRNHRCELISVQGCNSPTPKNISETVFLENISGTNFSVWDAHLYDSLRRRSCGSIGNLSLSQFPHLSFTFSPNITLFKCVNKTPDDQIQELVKTLGLRVYNRGECDKSGLVYYGKTTDDLPDIDKIQIPNLCKMIELPVNPSGDQDDLFSLLTPYVTLEWALHPACHPNYDCHKGSNRKTVILLAICIPGGVVLLLLLAVYIIWQKKKKFGGVYLLPRNISSDPSSRSFVEDGSFNFGIPIFSYTELVEATGDFDSSKELGDGGFGTVYYGKLKDGREVAIKRLYEHNYRRVEQFLNETQILTSLRHPNLVSLYGCTSRRSRELLLVYEYIPNGTVADHLHGERAKEALLTWPVRMSIARETATALAYLHKSDIIHRDVKTTNILLDNNFSVKVADFGLSRLFPLDVTHISTAPQGTPGYVDPEYHQCYQLTDKSDVYSFGVVLIELISSMPAVDISRHRHEINLANLAVNRIQRCAFDELIDPSTGYNSDPQVTMMTTSVAELAFRCLQLEKDLRPSMEEVVLFLQDIQSGQDCNFEEMKRGVGGNHGFHPSPETDAALLKSRDYHSSPTAVTDVWISSSSTVASSVA